jgi:hypothetical protein
LRFLNAVLINCIFCNTTFFISSMQVFSHEGRVYEDHILTQWVRI